MVGFLLNEATKAGVGFYANAEKALLADLGPDNIAILGTNLITSYGSTVGGAVTLTAGTDILSGNVFNAPQILSSTGDTRSNSLQDEDVLTGVGTNPTLTFTFGNPNLNGGTTITPTLNNIQTVNVAFTGSGAAVGGGGIPLPTPVLDVQDATGITTLNISRISDTTAVASVRNLIAEPTNISINQTNSPAAQVNVTTTNAALLGAANTNTLTLNSAIIGGYFNGSNAANAFSGLETMTLISNNAATGFGNVIGQMNVPGLQTLTIQGAADLSIGTPNLQVLSPVAGALTQSEAQVNQQGFLNVAGTLTSVNASAFTGNLNINFANEGTGGAVGTSGAPVNFSFLGGTGNDTVRFTATPADAAADTFNGGAGTNTLALAPTTGTLVFNAGTYTNFQVLDIRAGGDLADAAPDTITVNMALLASINTVTLRNEGQALDAAGIDRATAEQATFNLNNLTVIQAQNINVLHGTTGNNAIGQTILNAVLATNTTADTVGITINPGANAEVRNNWVFNLGNGAATVENVTIIDRDAESSTVALGNIAAHTGLLYVTGGTAGTFMNFDASNLGVGVDFYRLNEGGILAGTATGDVGVATPTTSVVEPGAGFAYRFAGTTFDSSTYLGDVVVRVRDSGAPNGAQTILMGAGNDTVIFDTLNNNRAGLSISDTVTGGAGNNTLVFDGDAQPISIGASEWTNVSGFQNIRVVGNGLAFGTVVGTQTINNLSQLSTPAAGVTYINAYNLTLTNDMINKNGGAALTVNIINDNDTGNNGRGADTAGTAVERGLTIDASFLDANHFFTYNGEEGGSRTADRIIVSDANLNGKSIIDGGAVFGGVSGAYTTSNLANDDVLEVRDAAVATAGDLANISNIGRIEFTNDLATQQTSVLELTATVLDALVNSTRAAAVGFVENLTVGSFNNPLVPTAVTTVQMDVRGLASAIGAETVTITGTGNFVITVTGAANQGQVIVGPGFTGTVTYVVSAAAPSDLDHAALVGISPVSADHFFM